jgi:hypothetical protein
MSDESGDLQSEQFLDPAGTAVLFKGMHDSSARVRIAMFEALIRLPLAPSDWVKVGAFGAWVLESSDSPEERLAVIDATPLIPVRSLHERVAWLAKVDEGKVQAHAAKAVAFWDPSALLTELRTKIDDAFTNDSWDSWSGEVSSDPSVRLARVDVSAVRDAVRQLCHAVPVDVTVRFWLALALACSGADEELKAIFADLESGSRYWYIDSYAEIVQDVLASPPHGYYRSYTLRYVLAGRPFPETTVRWLSAIAQSGRDSTAKALAAAVLEASAISLLRPLAPDEDPPGFTTYSAVEMSEARGALRRLGPDDDMPIWALDDNSLGWDPDAPVMGQVLDQDLAPAAVTMLLERAAGSSHGVYLLANRVVGWLQHVQTQFRPDLDGLFAVYWRLAEEASNTWGEDPDTWLSSVADSGPRTLCWQIGWTVSRGGLRGLASGLAAHLSAADRTERMAAAFLIADAADYVLQPYAPIFGGGSGPERRMVSEVLLDDVGLGSAWAQSHTKNAEPGPSEPPTEGPVPSPKSERRINVWVGGREEAVPGAVLVGQTFTLNFMVGQPVAASLVTGPGGAVPRSDVPPEGLETDWVVFSSDVEFPSSSPGVSAAATIVDNSTVWTAAFRLRIPFAGNSAVVQVPATPRRDDPAHFRVLIYARSELYRELTIALKVLAAGEAGGPAVTSAVERDIVRSPAAHLSLGSTHEWATPTGQLSIAVVGNQAIVIGDSYRLDDAGRRVGSTEHAQPRWDGAAGRVSGPMANVVATAERFRSRWEGYLNDIDPVDLLGRLGNPVRQYDWGNLQCTADAKHKQAWDSVALGAELHDLAFDGHALYEAFFPAGSQLRGILDALPPGHRVDFDWPPQEGYVPHVPWGLMYMLDVPRAGQPIDPLGFLGFRFRVGYTSHNVQSPGKALGRLDHTHAAHLLYSGDDPGDVTGTEARWQRQRWTAWTNQVVVPTASGDAMAELRQLIDEPAPPPMSVLYLFCQWGGRTNDPLLRFGPPARPYDLRRTDLGTRSLAGQPLVFANACTSAAAEPYVANLLEETFFSRGCRAYVGTETKVPIPMASRFALVFFHFFYTQVGGRAISAGEALSQARLFLWTNYGNIGGLFYTYVNTYELFMLDDSEVRDLRL